MIGDSVDLALFENVCKLLGGRAQQNNPLMGYYSCPNEKNVSLIFTLLCGSIDGLPFYPHCFSRFKDFHMWNQQLGDGKNASSWHTAPAAHLHEITTALVDIMGRSPELITFHAGLWDIAGQYSLHHDIKRLPNWFDNFEQSFKVGASQVITTLKSRFPLAKIVYRSPPPIVPGKLKHGVQERFQDKYYLAMYKTTREIAKINEIPFLDIHYMYKNHSFASADGLHLIGEVMMNGYFNVVLNSVCGMR
jgi:hypothetical protein